MLISIEGVYRTGKIELRHPPTNIPDETPVIITFLKSGAVDLEERGIDQKEADELRSRLLMFSEDWDNPEMDVYDNYDAFKGMPFKFEGSRDFICHPFGVTRNREIRSIIITPFRG